MPGKDLATGSAGFDVAGTVCERRGLASLSILLGRRTANTTLGEEIRFEPREWDLFPASNALTITIMFHLVQGLCNPGEFQPRFVTQCVDDLGILQLLGLFLGIRAMT